MNSCNVFINEKEYDGQYEVENGKVNLEIYNFSSGLDEDEVGSFITYKEIIIHDYRNKQFIYSPAFHYCGVTYSLTQYETFQTDFYLHTTKFENIENFKTESRIKSITFYHPLFIKYFSNPCLSFKHNGDILESKLNTKSDVRVVEVKHNNIERIEFGGAYSYKCGKDGQELHIETENYIQLFFTDYIELEDVLNYINELDVFINAYAPIGLRSFKTFIKMDNDKQFRLTHKLLGKEEYHKPIVRPVVKMKIFDFMEKMYKDINYRVSENKNKFLPLDFKKPTSLEDQFIYYFRYIDLFMGEHLMKKTGKEPSNFDRISNFVNDYLRFFEDEDKKEPENLKNELNSLRNHYVHEGYYLPNDEFRVTRQKKLLYMKKMDYKWLYRVTKALKLGVYHILYKEVLQVEIDENILEITNIK